MELKDSYEHQGSVGMTLYKVPHEKRLGQKSRFEFSSITSVQKPQLATNV